MCDCSSIAVADTCTQCCTVCYTNTDADSVTITCANGTALVVSDCRPVTCANCEAIFLSHKCSVRNSHAHSDVHTVSCSYCGSDFVPYKAPNNHQLHKWPTRWRRN